MTAMKLAAIALGCVFFGLSTAHAHDCAQQVEPHFTVVLPKVTNPPNPNGWNLPPVWGPINNQVGPSDTIAVPNGRPIYALIVSGYTNNAYLDQLMVYDFARHLMDQGAYVHYAWWNNLLAPYMERPLHHPQSHPGTASDITSFTTPAAAENKAVPGENHQFLADAKRFLSAIRAHNSEAVIVLVGHSMGGHSVAQLANETDVLIDLVAPIDPVWSRTYPWAGPALQNFDHYNWTRYRATSEDFKGYRSMKWEADLFGGGECVPFGPWRQRHSDALADSTFPCGNMVHVHGASHMTFGSNIINLYHRWQHEAKFPFDFAAARLFNPGFPYPSGGSQIQLAVSTQSGGAEAGGWPLAGLPKNSCCPNFNGVGWPGDGHGEIIGARGPVPPKPLGFRVRTSPECGSGCDNLIWPARTLSGENWSNPNAATRVANLQILETLPLAQTWMHEPYNPSLCRVSQPLINRFETMNKPPIADAGEDQMIECDGCTYAIVILDAGESFDPDGMPLTYTWTGPFGNASGELVEFEFPLGVHCVTLEVKDSVGHIARDYVTVSIVDPASPIAPYISAVGPWSQHTGEHEAYAFDEFFPA